MQKQTDTDFLNALTKKCEFYIDKNEVAVYSDKFVEQYKDFAYISNLQLNEYIEQKLNMTEDEFYDYCYNLGEEEIKRYLLVGAYSNDYTDLSENEQFIKFCSMMGYDSTANDNNEAKYAFLERECVNNLSQTGLYVHTVGYSIPLNSKKEYTVDLYTSSNIYGINYSERQQAISKENQQEIISLFQNLMFGQTTYNLGNNLYDTVLTFNADGENTVKIMIDQKNGFVSMKCYDAESGYPYIVVTEFTEELRDLITLDNTVDGGF